MTTLSEREPLGQVRVLRTRQSPLPMNVGTPHYLSSSPIQTERAILCCSYYTSTVQSSRSLGQGVCTEGVQSPRTNIPWAVTHFTVELCPTTTPSRYHTTTLPHYHALSAHWTSRTSSRSCSTRRGARVAHCACSTSTRSTNATSAALWGRWEASAQAR